MGPVLGPHARTDRTWDTRVAEPWLPAQEDERPGEGQRLTPGLTLPYFWCATIPGDVTIRLTTAIYTGCLNLN